MAEGEFSRRVSSRNRRSAVKVKVRVALDRAFCIGDTLLSLRIILSPMPLISRMTEIHFAGNCLDVRE